MSDLISRCQLFNRLAPVQTLGEAYGVIQGMQAVDAVEVVRCRECRWWDISPASTAAPAYHECKARGICSAADDFCKRGERKDDADGV